MALDKAGLIVDLEAMYDALQDATIDAATAKENFVNSMADAIEHYVKSATIYYANGLVAPGGPVTGAFNGSLE